MSGGSMDYLYFKLQDARFEENTVERRAFRQHLDLVARVLKAIEWNDSGDGDRLESYLIRECLSKSDILLQAVKEAEEMIETLNEEIKRVKKQIEIQEDA